MINHVYTKNCRAESLPSEVLTTILKQVSPSILLQCLSVCKSWYYPAAQLYYHTITLKDNKSQSNTLLKLVNHLQANARFSAGAMVRTLQIESQQQTTDGDRVQQLLQLCPYTQEIVFSANTVHWKILQATGTETIQPKVLKTIPARQWRSKENYFYKAAHTFRGSVAHLDVDCTCDKSLREDFGGLFAFLAQFPVLESLSIRSGSQRYLVYLEQLLETCKTLTTLSYQLDHPLSEDPMLSVDSVGTYPSMKSLDVYVPNFSSKHIRYMMRRFSHLKSMTLRMNHSDGEQRRSWEEEENEDSMHHFERVRWTQQFFKGTFVPFFLRLENGALDLNIHDSSYVEQMIEDDYLSLISTSEQTYKTEAVFLVHNGRKERTHVSITKGQKEQHIKYTFVRDLAESADDGDRDSSELRLPYMRHLQIYGKRIYSLTVVNTVKSCYEESADIELLLELCPNLEKLVVHYDPSSTVHFSRPSVHPLSLSSYQRPQGMHGAAVNPKLSVMELVGVRTSPELLETIEKCCPCLTDFSTKQ